ncbi:MAG: cupin domain-containing protein [Pseudonocardiaceae bacterium]|nr:cupin domain-containing protein [Pseudonocardiaceae bacterium]
MSAQFLDISGRTPPGPLPWSPVKIPREEIEGEVERLATIPQPADGRRASLVVHPDSDGLGPGLAPGVDVTINVLKPGEQTTPVRHNASQVDIGIRGSGIVHVGEQDIRLASRDVCNIPSMKGHSHRNDGDDLWVRLTYSNVPLLAKLGVHYFEDLSSDQLDRKSDRPERDPNGERYTRANAPDVEIGAGGARLRGYEYLVDIEVVENKAHLWPWHEVSQHLRQQPGDGKRMIMVLYNPATERRTGTTHSFFVTAAVVPPGTPSPPRGRGHRHSSMAINYHFQGSGASVVDGELIEWRAGDLLLSAPGWSEHAHYWGFDGFGIFTVQDHPLHIGMESLVWQEEMDGPILALGSEPGQTGYVGPREAGE